VLQSKCFRIATGAPWYVSNRQIHKDVEIPFFSDHIRVLMESLNSKLADAGNPLVRQLGRQGLSEVSHGYPRMIHAQKTCRFMFVYTLLNDAFSVSQNNSVDVGCKPAASAQFLLNPDSSARAI
jgi:hypothetical protein